jgi:circadian clock protein KaiB
VTAQEDAEAIANGARGTLMTAGTAYELTLYVSGASDLSARAIANAKRLCDAHLGDNYALEVVDVNEDLASAMSCHILATPTLVRHAPTPVRRVVGDLSNAAAVLRSLEILIA